MIDIAATDDIQELKKQIVTLFTNTTFLQQEIKDLEGQLEGQWQHIRNLEERLNNPKFEYMQPKLYVD